MVATRRLTQLVDEISKLADFPTSPLLVALSGGADSAALAYVAVGIGVPVRALHVDHSTPHSQELRSAAEAIADQLSMSLDVVVVSSGEPFSEEVAREARYEALLAARARDEWVATAHTLDDQAETVLLNVIRGSGTAGLTGIPRRTSRRVARPFLDVTRSSARELAILAGLPYVDDPSNADVGFTRNRLRLDVIPLLEAEFNPRLSESLSRLAAAARQDEEFLSARAARLPAHRDGNTVSIPISVLVTSPRPLADRALRSLLSHIRPPHPPTRAELTRLWEVVEGSAARAELEGRVIAVAQSGVLVMEKGDLR